MHQIGVGVLGPVFRSYHPDDDRLVALKAFHLDITPELASRLAGALNEIAQSGLSHPSLVAPIGAGLADGIPYLALEYVAAESLDVALRHYAPAVVGTALPWVVQMAEALDAAHAVGLSHGALHPRDIFLTPALAWVNGFGVVSALERVRLRGPLRRPYTAPEQIAGAEWGPAADRFALAAIAYELLTGKRAAGTGEQVTDRLAELSGVRDAAILTRLFASALADRPETRPVSARRFVDELADAVGWTGADAVRQNLVKTDSEAGDPEHQVLLDDAPVIAVAGLSTRPSARVESTGTEGAALTMANTNRPTSTPEPELDWTERTLDHGESDELREPEAYRPRPPGAPPAVERAMHAERDAVLDVERDDAAPEAPQEVERAMRAERNAVPDFERIDAAPEAPQEVERAVHAERGAVPDFERIDAVPEAPQEVERAVHAERGAVPDFERIDAVLEAIDDTIVADGDGSRQESVADLRSHGESRTPEPEADDPDCALPTARARVEIGVGAEGASGQSAGSLLDRPDPEPSTSAVHTGRSSPLGDPGDRLSGDRDDAGSDDGLDPALEEDDDLSVVQARYRPADDRAELLSDAADSQAAGVYEPITLSELQDRLGDTADLPEDDPDDDQERSADLAAGSQTWDDAADDRGDGMLSFESDGEDDYDQSGYDEGAPGVVASLWTDRARGLPMVPLALVAAVITVVSLALVFDWMPGGAGAATDEPTAEAVVAGSLPDLSTTPEPVEPAPQVSRTFSEATVGSLVEPSPTPPVAEPAPEEPEIPESTPRPSPVAAAAAPVASAPIAPTVAEPTPAGRLLVRSSPPGVRVVVNGAARGTTPLSLADLSNGVYDVRLLQEGYEAQEHRLTISSDDPFAGLDAELARIVDTRTASLGVGSVFVDTRPTGVEVWFDQQLVGETPMLIPDVSAGVHDVEFRSDGYRDWTTTVQVGSSAQARVTASLDHVPR